MSSASASTAPARPRSASTGGWMPRTTERRSPRAACVVDAGVGDHPRAVSGSGCIRLVGQAEAHRQRDQPGLRTVVQVALDPAQLGRRVVDRARRGSRSAPAPAPRALGAARGRNDAVHRRARPHHRPDVEPPQRDRSRGRPRAGSSPSVSIVSSHHCKPKMQAGVTAPQEQVAVGTSSGQRHGIGRRADRRARKRPTGRASGPGTAPGSRRGTQHVWRHVRQVPPRTIRRDLGRPRPALRRRRPAAAARGCPRSR